MGNYFFPSPITPDVLAMTPNTEQVANKNDEQYPLNTYMALPFKFGCAVNWRQVLVKELSNRQLNLNIFNASKQLILCQTASTQDQRDIENTLNVPLYLFWGGVYFTYIIVKLLLREISQIKCIML